MAAQSTRLALVALLACMASARSFAADAGGPPFDLAEPARIEAGKLRFGASCAAYCHGSEGSGGRAPAFKGRDDFDPVFAFQIITKGRRGADIMPPWGNAYSPEEIWELVAYLQFLAAQPASE